MDKNKVGRKYNREKWGWKNENEIKNYHYDPNSRERQMKDSSLFSFIGWVGILAIVIMCLIGSCSKAQAQNVVFVDYKWQSDITIYITNNKWQADEVVKFVRYKWEMGGRNVWRKVRRNYPGAVKIYVTNRRWEADRIVWYRGFPKRNRWQVSNRINHRAHHCHPKHCRR